MSNTFCTGCGAQLAPGSSFCASCGAQVEAAQQARPAYGAAPLRPGYNRQPRGRLSAGAIMGIIGAVLVVTGVILLVVLLGGGGDASVTADDICGRWKGSIKIENVNTNIPGLSDYADLDYMKEQLGKEQEMTLYIESSDRNGGITVSGSMFYNMDAVYKNGRLTMEQGQGDDVKLKLEGGVSRKGDTYAFKGTWKGTYKDQVFASGSWTVEMEDRD